MGRSHLGLVLASLRCVSIRFVRIIEDAMCLDKANEDL